LKVPYWLLKHLPLFDYICPACKGEVSKNSRKCVHCGEQFGVPIRVPPKVLKDQKALEEYVHKHIFPKVSMSQREYLTRFFTTLFSDGFESGDFSAWTGTSVPAGCTAVVDSASPVHHGTYSAKMTRGSGATGSVSIYAYKDFAGQVTAYARAYFQLTALPASAQENSPLYLYGALLNFLSKIKITYQAVTPVYRWTVVYRSGGENVQDNSYTTSTPQINTWYCIELKQTQGAGTGETRVYIDGVEIYTKTGLTNNDQETQVGRVWVAVGYCNYVVTNTLDCVVVADTYIGPEGAAEGQPYISRVQQIAGMKTW